MDLKIKLLELLEGSYYLIVIAQGIINSEALKRVFTDVQEITRPLLHCKVFIDQRGKPPHPTCSYQFDGRSLVASSKFEPDQHGSRSNGRLTVAGACSCCEICYLVRT